MYMYVHINLKLKSKRRDDGSGKEDTKEIKFFCEEYFLGDKLPPTHKKIKKDGFELDQHDGLNVGYVPIDIKEDFLQKFQEKLNEKYSLVIPDTIDEVRKLADSIKVYLMPLAALPSVTKVSASLFNGKDEVDDIDSFIYHKSPSPE